jgi:hypothetical protein
VAGEQYLSLPVYRSKGPKSLLAPLVNSYAMTCGAQSITLSKSTRVVRFSTTCIASEISSVPMSLALSIQSAPARQTATKVPVQYGISRAQLGPNILRSFGDDSCLWRTFTVFRALRLTEKSDWHKSRVFVNIRMKLTDELEACSTCDARLGGGKRIILDNLEVDWAKTFLSCTRCNHTRKSARLPHLILVATQTPQGPVWHLFCSNGIALFAWGLTLETELRPAVQMLSWESDVAVLQLSLGDLIRLLLKSDAANKLDYPDRQNTNDSRHVPNWRLECSE